uniref:Uncharacterized protein n=1 Tax=Arundo donax TaxID=35708 RepID=A0A0A8Z9C4_ARUDO
MLLVFCSLSKGSIFSCLMKHDVKKIVF